MKNKIDLTCLSTDRQQYCLSTGPVLCYPIKYLRHDHRLMISSCVNYLRTYLFHSNMKTVRRLLDFCVFHVYEKSSKCQAELELETNSGMTENV